MAQVAQNWANKCDFEHSESELGENMAVTSLYSLPGDGHIASDTELHAGLKKIVDKWIVEKSKYDHTSNTCAVAKHCGHYTQVSVKYFARKTLIIMGFFVI